MGPGKCREKRSVGEDLTSETDDTDYTRHNQHKIYSLTAPKLLVHLHRNFNRSAEPRIQGQPLRSEIYTQRESRQDLRDVLIVKTTSTNIQFAPPPTPSMKPTNYSLKAVDAISERDLSPEDNYIHHIQKDNIAKWCKITVAKKANKDFFTPARFISLKQKRSKLRPNSNLKGSLQTMTCNNNLTAHSISCDPNNQKMVSFPKCSSDPDKPKPFKGIRCLSIQLQDCQEYTRKFQTDTSNSKGHFKQMATTPLDNLSNCGPNSDEEAASQKTLQGATTSRRISLFANKVSLKSINK